MTFSAPGANVFNAYLGWNGLTNLPRGAWSTLTFPLPASVQAALLGDTANAQFSILLNVASCQAPMLIDNLRMGGNLVSRTVPHRVGSEDLSITTNTLFSFENTADWSSSQTILGGNTAQKSHGDASLSVPAVSWVEVKSRAFSTSETPGATAKLNLDVFVPAPQPNATWAGAVQAYFSCPAAGLYNVYVGQQSLNNRFVGEFNSLVFDLPASVVTVLQTANRTRVLIHAGAERSARHRAVPVRQAGLRQLTRWPVGRPGAALLPVALRQLGHEAVRVVERTEAAGVRGEQLLARSARCCGPPASLEHLQRLGPRG